MEKKQEGFDEAIQPFKEWLYNFRKVKPSMIASDQSYLDEIEIIAEKVLDKTIEIQENGELKIHLAFPLGKDEQIKNLVFKSRIKAGEVAKAYLKVKPGDGTGHKNALIAVASGNLKEIIDELDTADQALLSKLMNYYYLY